MTDVNKGPLYTIIDEEWPDGLCTAEILATGKRICAIAEHIRLANADAMHGERPRASGDYS